MDAYRAGNYETSWIAYEKTIALGEDSSVAHYNAACSYALGNRSEDAFRHLFAALDGGYADADHVSKDGDLASLHDDPRWEALLDSMRALERSEALRWEGEAFRSGYRDDLTVDEKVAGLSRIWAEAKYGFAYFHLVPGLDWDARYLEFLPRVRATESTVEYYRVLMIFISALRDGHTMVWPPRDMLLNRFLPRPGIRTVLIDGRVIVRDVWHDSAREAGMREGDEIVTIDGVPAIEHAERNLRPYQSASTRQDLEARVFDFWLLAGDVTASVRLDVRGADGEVRAIELPRLPWAAVRASQPPFALIWLDGNIAHLEINALSDGALAGFETALPEVRTRARGVILDVRDNNGGNSEIAFHILANFTEEPFKSVTGRLPAYVSAHRVSGLPQEFKPLPVGEHAGVEKAVRAPVAMLIGSWTYSSAEHLAAAFDQMDRGALIGQPTGGGTGRPLRFDLPGGGSAMIATTHLRYADGREIAGIGVQPDMAVAPSIASLRRGDDVVLKNAVRWLKSQVMNDE